MEYQIELENFTGPLDLLLFFIRRDEIDIMDIPIARITEEYLSYLEAFQTLNIAVAGEFVVMAATLMRIKARMLLPRHPEGDQEEIEDPRTELAYRLLDYQRYSEAAVTLSAMMESQGKKFPHPVTIDSEEMKPDPLFYLGDVSLFELVRVFKELMEQLPPSVTYDVAREQVDIQERIAFLLTKFVDRDTYKFSQLFPDFASRRELIATFMAILELIRDGQVRVLQKRIFHDFVLERIPPDSVGEA
ncbi:MAG: segregation and condensation protein A [Fidelibacterota bacterium]